MKKSLFITFLSACLLGMVAPAYAQTTPTQPTSQGDTAKVRERMKKDQKKSADGKYMLKPKKAKGKTKQPKAIGE
ncbi:hypothetical protein [Hymenobacter volaticus]|uniref:Uncharacterized protein n=1 Tax=Hymenobacter volaticus TaxID=2932254 RepID=A0ABY4GA15_9BACT|nr:hypothetical protein [Hymenobacter volaticus]UOQ67752.1 hypothetical protein MUN86_07785 [Hymenobacter volaticus]